MEYRYCTVGISIAISRSRGQRTRDLIGINTDMELTRGALFVCVLTLLGCASRLWNLHHPETPIYDETHVGRFLNWYHEGKFFF